MLPIQNVTADVTFQHLGHETVHSSPGGAHDLQHFRAIPLFVEGSYKGLDLSLNAFRAEQQVVLFSDRVAHAPTIPYPVWYVTTIVALSLGESAPLRLY